jgi:hypothetical protein
MAFETTPLTTRSETAFHLFKREEWRAVRSPHNSAEERGLVDHDYEQDQEHEEIDRMRDSKPACSRQARARQSPTAPSVNH